MLMPGRRNKFDIHVTYDIIKTQLFGMYVAFGNSRLCAKFQEPTRFSSRDTDESIFKAYSGVVRLLYGKISIWV